MLAGREAWGTLLRPHAGDSELPATLEVLLCGFFFFFFLQMDKWRFVT